MLTFAKSKNRDQALNKNGLGSIFWQCASRKDSILERRNARGKASELVCTGTFWCDIDTGKKKDATLQQSVDALLNMPLKPTFIYFTGGGLQAVHVLKEPYDLSDVDYVSEYKKRSLSFYKDVLKDIPGFDTGVHEAARHMRLVGYTNRKTSRLGAAACIIYYNPANVYSLAEIFKYAPLPGTPIRQRQKRETENGVYEVSGRFVRLMVDKEPVQEVVPNGRSRHQTMIQIALDAAAAGISEDIFREELRPVANVWYANDRADATDTELDLAVQWAYQQTNPKGGFGYAVKLTPQGFIEDILERDDTKSITPIELKNRLSLGDVRDKMRDSAIAYLNTPYKNPTALLITAPPGTGKSKLQYDLIDTLVRENNNCRLFVHNSDFSRDTIAQFNPELAMCAYLYEARNDDKTSKGYCERKDRANRAAGAGYSAYYAACTTCPLNTLTEDCKARFYRSQKRDFKRAPFAVARHENMVDPDLLYGSDYIHIDECPLDVPENHRLFYEVGDLAPRNVFADMIHGDHEEKQQILDDLNEVLTAFRHIITDIPKSTEKNLQIADVWYGTYQSLAPLAPDKSEYPDSSDTDEHPQSQAPQRDIRTYRQLSCCAPHNHAENSIFATLNPIARRG